MHYGIWKNRLESDSILLKSTDSMFTSTIASLSGSGIGWMKLLLQRDVFSNTIAGSLIDAQTIEVTVVPLREMLTHVESVPWLATQFERQQTYLNLINPSATIRYGCRRSRT